jgi:hypothetical protein
LLTEYNEWKILKVERRLRFPSLLSTFNFLLSANFMNKKNFTLIIILALLIILAYLYQGPWQSWRANKNVTKNFLASVNVDQANRIEITKNGETTTLVLNGSRWKIDGTKDFYVSDANAQNVVARLKDLTATQLELVSTNQTKKIDFNTDSISGVNVKLNQGSKEIASFIVGKINGNYTGTYLSPTGLANTTYLTKVDIYDAFVQNDWYDKNIFASDKTKINSVKFKNNGKEFNVAKQGDDWYATGTTKIKLNKDKVNGIVDLLASLVAAAIPDQNATSTGLSNSQLVVQATGDGIDNTIIVGNDNGQGQYYVKRENSDNIYLIAKAERDKLNVQIKDLK